jgi:hypothetical protein
MERHARKEEDSFLRMVVFRYIVNDLVYQTRPERKQEFTQRFKETTGIDATLAVQAIQQHCTTGAQLWNGLKFPIDIIRNP